ncbi:hypothetical protein IMSHALPRED_006454 [Imshaugia aleurites]|uniref:Uncharacterized protein n=1 Tax=Imshaugia aleurites TaxID=172621 RepID=A0A8H3FIR0_9LECA|nr:hypothetical protein IMSHALPRED_006454 [Imshaugia aleurites]
MKLDEKMKILDDGANDNNVTINTDVVSFHVSPQHPQYSTTHTLTSNHAVTHDRQESTWSQSKEYGFVLDFLNGLKPLAIRLQESIMPNPFTLPTPIPPQSVAPIDTTPTIKVPSFATRRAACTHLTMERLYGNFTCNVCSRFSNFGWVYCCTQDNVPESQITLDSISEISSPPHQHLDGGEEEASGVNDLSMLPPAVDEDPRLRGEDTPMPTAQLSPWIEKAIKDGHYTPEQVAKLRAQKQHVVDTARAAVELFEQSQTNTTIFTPQTPTTLQSVDANPHLPFPVINQVEEPSAAGSSIDNEALARQRKARMFPFCKFCACQLCRPTHRDRAWQHFDDVFENEQAIPFIDYEDRNRPLASASIMSRIGLRPPRLPKHPFRQSIDARAIYSRNDSGQVLLNNDIGSSRKSTDPTSSSSSSNDIADMNIEAESKGFRESVKRAFKGMLLTRGPSARSHRKRKARDGTDTTEEDAVEFDMGLWKELNDELLREASGVPLPEKDSIEGLSRDVAEMGVGGMGGVAVTEEAADLGTADVIMSV